jgi:hypothetical protein
LIVVAARAGSRIEMAHRHLPLIKEKSMLAPADLMTDLHGRKHDRQHKKL